MSAQPSSRPPLPSPSHHSSRRLATRARRSPRRDPHRATTVEVTARLGVNLLLSSMAVAALIKLLPYNLDQQSRLQEIRSDVAELDAQVDQLQAEFDRNFDPNQTMEVMREQSARVTPNQRQVIWMNPASASTAQSAPDAVHPDQQAFSPQRD